MKKLLIIIIIIAVAICSWGCCKDKKQNYDLKPLWSVKVSPYLTYGSGLGNIEIHNDIAIVPIQTGQDDSRIAGVNINTRNIEWVIPKEEQDGINYGISGGFLFDDKVICTSYDNISSLADNAIYCFAINTQEKLWEYVSSSPKLMLQVIYEDKAYALRSGNYDLYEMDLNTRDTIKLFNMSNVRSLPALKVDSATMSLLYITKETDGNYFNRYDIVTETITGHHKLPTNIGIDTYMAYTIYNNSLYYCYYESNSDRYICCVDMITWQIKWQYKYTHNAMGGNIIIHNGIAFMSSPNIYVGLNAETGQKLYEVNNVSTSSTIVYGNYVYTYRMDISEINIINIRNGNIVAKITPPVDKFDFSVRPTIYNGKLYIMDYTTLYCYPTYPWN